jgi:hypothetical protein
VVLCFHPDSSDESNDSTRALNSADTRTWVRVLTFDRVWMRTPGDTSLMSVAQSATKILPDAMTRTRHIFLH